MILEGRTGRQGAGSKRASQPPSLWVPWALCCGYLAAVTRGLLASPSAWGPSSTCCQSLSAREMLAAEARASGLGTGQAR